MAGNHDMDTYETCADIRMSQSVDLGSALPKVPSRPRCAWAHQGFSIDAKNCPI
jgi:hypothetical protein